MTMPFTEDTLVQQTTAEYLRDELGWDTVYAYGTETFGPEGTLGRRDFLRPINLTNHDLLGRVASVDRGFYNDKLFNNFYLRV